MAAVATAGPNPIGGGTNEDDPILLCNTIYVSPDPTIGNNLNPGTIKEPFLNIQDAIWEASLNLPAVVVLLPGTYSQSTNYEYFPIEMQEDVSIQGTSAMNTILDGEGYGDDLLWFYGMYGNFHETYVDGITLRRGRNAVTMESEFDPVGPTISNCFITENSIGVRMYAIWDYDTQSYPHFFPRIVNNTIVENEIGVLDDTKVLPPPFNGPYDGKGVAQSAIINNIILFNSDVDLSGPDASDVKSCVFVTQNPNKIVGGIPLTWSWANTLTLLNTFVNSLDGDYRLLPRTLVEDIGTLDLFVDNGNEVTQVSPCGMDILDFDGEGYGNERLRLELDLGADERDDMIIAGYKPWTTSFDQTYNTMHINIDPKLSVGNMLNARLWFGRGDARWNKIRVAPGARAKGTARKATTLNFGNLWIQRNSQIISHAVQVHANSWFSLPVPSVSVPCHWNVQSLSSGSTQTTNLSNLQSFIAQ